MVEYSPSVELDIVFMALADPTRRDILERLRWQELTVGEVAEPYAMSLAAVSKHLKLLERAQLIHKRKSGKERLVALAPEMLQEAAGYLRQYEPLQADSFEPASYVIG